MSMKARENPELNIQGMMKIEDARKSDQLFEKTGIEDLDVEPSIDRLGIRADPEYREIV